MEPNAKQSRFKDYFLKTVSGFFIGIGFSISLLCVLSIANYFVNSLAEKETEIKPSETYKSTRVEFDENSGLLITSHESKIAGNKLIILGQVQNVGSNKWKHINIEAELFDSNQKFIDECSTYISGTIKVNESRNFKVVCGGCDDAPLVKFSTYKINVVDAFHDN